MKQRMFLVLVFISMFIPCIAFAEQQILFCAESFRASASFRRDECRAGCAKYGAENCVKSQMDAGWNIVSSNTREVRPLEPGIDCTCEGMEYVLSKEVKKSAGQMERGDQKEREVALLTKENELLKMEIGQLKSDIDTLKSQNSNLKAKPSKSKP